MPSPHVPLKEQARRARRRRLETVLALAILAFALALFRAIG
jgi:hypothetical protein